MEDIQDSNNERKDLLKMVALLMLRNGISEIEFTSDELTALHAKRPNLAIVINGGGDFVRVSLEDRPPTEDENDTANMH